MPTMIEVKCKRCKTPFMARVADRNRGWGKFCSKSCKAVTQEKRTGQMGKFIRRVAQVRRPNQRREYDGFYDDSHWNSSDAHGQE